MACKLYLIKVVFLKKDLSSSVKFNYNFYCSITDIIKSNWHYLIVGAR